MLIGMAFTLRDGSRTKDERLDRLVHFDDRSREYPVMVVVEETKPRSYTWKCPVVLDQGREGACVGFSCSHELAAAPVEIPVTNQSAIELYYAAQRIDEFPGGAYPGASPRADGSSVLAGAKVLHQEGYLEEYRWAFDINDLVLAVGYKGPAILGIPWYRSMFEPASDGHLRVSGTIAGGHAICCIGVDVKKQTFTLHNSWGRDWGKNGDATIHWDDLDRLLHKDGEACIPVRRTKPASVSKEEKPKKRLGRKRERS